MWDERRLRLLSWLTSQAPHLAPVYQGAVMMATDRTFPGRVPFVWHAMREIRNRLPDALDGEARRSMVQWADLTRPVDREWVGAGLPSDGSPPWTGGSAPSPSGPPNEFVVPSALIVAVGGIVAGGRDIEGRHDWNARRMYAAAGFQSVSEAVIRAWVTGVRNAHRYAHIPARAPDPRRHETLEMDLRAFESDLLALGDLALETLNEMDVILASANE